MIKSRLLATTRLIIAAAVLAAILTQLLHSHTLVKSFSFVNFFSFFTVEANLFGAFTFVMSATLLIRGIRNPLIDKLRGAATLYMVITGIIYSLLLTGVDVQASIPWCNLTLHYLFPVVILLDWIVFRAPQKISYGKSLYWLIFPFAYAVYSLVRGPFAHHWYPYPFINAAKFGYGRVLLNALVIAIGVIALSLILIWITTIQRKTVARKHA